MKLSSILESVDLGNVISRYHDVIKSAVHYRKLGVSIYRGMDYRDQSPLSILNHPINRRSANTFNHYTLWMDNHPDWEMYPKRSQSFICSSHSNYAAGYGVVYWMIPLKPTAIGIANACDLWHSFDPGLQKWRKMMPRSYGLKSTTTTLETFNDYLMANGIPDQTWEAMSEALRLSPGVVNMETTKEILSPVVNHFKLCSSTKPSWSATHEGSAFASNELWFSETALCVKTTSDVCERLMQTF